MTKLDFESIINPFIDEKFKEGSVKITRTSLYTYGIRTPILRQLAKDLYKNRPDYRDYFFSLSECSFEEILLLGMQFTHYTDYQRLISDLKMLIPRFDSWAHTDQIIADFKCVKSYADYLDYFSYLKAGTEFEKRSYVIMLLKCCYAKSASNILTKKIFSELLTIPSGEYYVDMAVAWTLAELFAKDYSYMKSCVEDLASFSPFILKKAAQKCRDSFRITPEEKIEITNIVKSITK